MAGRKKHEAHPSGEAQVVTATFMTAGVPRSGADGRNLHGSVIKLVDLLETRAYRGEVEGQI